MTIWSSETWKQRKSDENELIKPFEPARIKHGAYELGAHKDYALAPEGKLFRAEQGQRIEIPPGHFALLMTEERVFVPDDTLGFISLKASWKLRGLVNVSGFHVDPGFKGRLKFSVYNAGGAHLAIEPETPLFLIWYSKLDRTTDDVYDGSRKHQDKITPTDLDKLKGIVASPAGLSERIDTIDRRLNEQINNIEKNIVKLQSGQKYHWLFLGLLFAMLITLLAKVW